MLRYARVSLGFFFCITLFVPAPSPGISLMFVTYVYVFADDPLSRLLGWLGPALERGLDYRSAFGADTSSQLTGFACTPNWCLGVGARLSRRCRPTWWSGFSWASGGALSGCRVKALVGASPLGCALADAGWSSVCLAWPCQRLQVYGSLAGTLPSAT